MAEASMRTVVGDHSVTELLTVGRESNRQQGQGAPLQSLQALRQRHAVQQLVLQDVDPPELVKPSFNAVNQAIQERERAINKPGPSTPGDPPRTRPRGAEDRGRRGLCGGSVNRAKGDAQRSSRSRSSIARRPR